MANSKNITFDQLQNALTRVKSALDGKANTSHGNHVPKIETANNAKFLRNDNTWQTITPVNIGAADRSHSHGSYVNQNAFSNIKVGDTTVAADSPTDTLTLTAGANVTLTPDATNDTVTIAAKDTVYTHPTTSGNKHIPSGGSSGQILRWSADGTAAWGSDNNTDTKVTNTLNTTAKAYVTGTTSATTNTGTQVFDTGVYLDATAGQLVASTFSGALSGNASSATKLQNARNIKIGNTTRSFNGTADVTWTLGEIGAASSGHTHSSIRGTDGGSWASATVNTTDGGLFQFAADVVKTAKGIFTASDNANAIISFGKHTGNYASQLGFNNSGDIFYRSADGSALADSTAWKQIAFTSSSITGNAASATKLQNARNFKIGNTSRSFNGTSDVTWTLSDIGAAAASHNHTSLTGVTKLQFAAGSSDSAVMKVTTEEANTYLDFEMNDDVNTDMYRWRFSAYDTNGATPYFNLMTLTAKDTSSARLTVNGDVTASSFTGNASSATKLQNARTINGTSFNGTANITTANWGTARTLTIGSSGKSVNGSANVSWTLDEIGAAAKSHGNHVPATQAADNKKFLRNDNTWQTVTPDNIGAVPIDTGGNITIHADSDASSTSEYALIKAGHNELKVASSAGGGTVTKGQDKLTFNGNIVYHAGRKPTLSELGAAASNHSHSNYAASNHSHNNYAASSHEHNYLNVKGTNTINTTANDTTAKWGAQKNSVHWYTETNKINGQPSQWGYLVNIGQDSEVHQVWMTQSSGDLLHRGGNNSGWSGSWRTILDSENYSTWAAAKSHTHNYAASNHTHNYAAANHTHNYAASNHNHDSAYLKLSGGTLSGQLTVNNTVQSQGFCVSKNGKEVWLDIGDNDTYIWTSGANKSLQITHGGDLNFDGKPVIYGGRGNSFSTAVGSIYFKNSANTYAARISSYHNTDLNQDYAHMGIRDVNDNMPNYINLYPDTVRIKSNNIELGGKRLTIATSAPSNPSNGDVWINIG